MPRALHTPRLNNNDDVVTVRQIIAPAGTQVRHGDPLVELETDKAIFAVESEQDGYVLKVMYAEGEQAAVGSVLVWMGERADEDVPQERSVRPAAAAPAAAPTAKAQMLLARYGLSADEVPFEGARLTAAAVESIVLARGLQPRQAAGAAAARQDGGAPAAAGEVRKLTAEERGMLRTVAWQRDSAVAGFVEIAYDERPWAEYGLAFQKEHRILVNPVLSLMAWRLAQTARANPRLNATMVEAGRYEYGCVNLGFTVQSGDSLYLVVVEDAGAMDETAFVNRLSELQRKAMAHALSPAETQGATVGFSSMARWQVTRHVPVLPPYTSLMVAHTAGVLGATYDHRVLSGVDVVNTLKAIAAPGTGEQA